MRKGFLLSALIHAAGAAMLLPLLHHPAGQPGEETPLSLSLAMFETPNPARDSTAPEPLAEQEAELIPKSPSSPSKASRIETEESSLDPIEPPPQPKSPKAKEKPLRKHEQPKPPEPKPKPSRERVSKAAPKQAPRSRSASSPAQPTPAASTGQHGSAAKKNLSLTEIEDVRKRYLAGLTKRIQRSKFYPTRARMAGQQGQVMVTFTIEKSGRIKGVQVTRSSGHGALDAAAVTTVRRISPFRPIPDELKRARWKITVPIIYSLRR